MADATVTLNLLDALGVPFDARRTKVWAEFNTETGWVVDADGDIRMDAGVATIDETGLVTLAGIPIPSGSTNPTDWQIKIHFDAPFALPGVRGLKRKRGDFGWMSIDADADLTDLIAEQYVPPTWLSTAQTLLQSYIDQGADILAAQIAISGIDDTDSAIAALIDPLVGPLTTAALADWLLQKPTTDLGDWALLRRDTSDVSKGVAWTTASEAIARGLGWKIATDAVYAGGADPTGVSSSVAAAEAMVAAANSGSGKQKFWFPPGTYKLTAGLTSRTITAHHVTVLGSGKGETLFKVNAGVLFTWDSNATGGGCQDIEFQSDTTPNISQCLFEIGTAGAQTFTRLKVANLAAIARLGVSGGLASQPTFSDIIGYTNNLAGAITFDCIHGAVLTMHDVTVYANCGFPTDATSAHPAAAGTTGIRFGQGQWDTFNIRNVNLNRYDLDFDFGSTHNVSNGWVDACVFDYAKTAALRIAPASGGDVRSIYFTGCWGVASDGHSFTLDGTYAIVKHIHFTDCVGRQAGKNNWRFAGTNMSEIQLLNSHGLGANRLAGTNTGSEKDDLVILGGGVTVKGGLFGEDGAPYVGFTNQGRYGINVSPDLPSVAIIGVEAIGATGKILLNANTSASDANARRRLVRDNRTKDGSALDYATTTSSTATALGVTSSATQTHRAPTVDYLTILGGTVTNIVHNGASVGTTGPAHLLLHPGDTWSIVYSSTPTIVRRVCP